jgi:hypothetical protein
VKREFSKELEEDRDFEIGGEVFSWTYPTWEQTASLYDEDLKPSDNGDGSFSFTDDTKFAIEKVKLFLDGPDQRKRWDALTKRKAKPIPRHQIVQLYRWLIQEAGGNPTKPSSDSSESEAGTNVSSGGGSS